MNFCPECNHRGTEKRCPADGFPMVAEDLFERPPLAANLVGQCFDERYEIQALIGQGGMGWVFRARHLTMGHGVALKVMRRELVGNSIAIKRFFREVQACSRLKHPNTIKVYDFGVSEDGYLFLVMELLDGSPLSRVHKQSGPMAVRRIVHIAKQVCKSLHEAHGLGLVHRDLKLANIFLTEIPGEQDFVKVLDFGIVKFTDSDSGEETLTGKSLLIGTPAYMSPEQMLADKVDGRSDLYSLGVVLYQLTSGKLPFPGKSPEQVLAQRLRAGLTPLAMALPAGLPPPWPPFCDLVHDLLEENPALRPGSAAHVIERLDKLESDSSGFALAMTPSRVPQEASIIPLAPATRGDGAHLAIIAAGCNPDTTTPPRLQGPQSASPPSAMIPSRAMATSFRQFLRKHFVWLGLGLVGSIVGTLVFWLFPSSDNAKGKGETPPFRPAVISHAADAPISSSQMPMTEVVDSDDAARAAGRIPKDEDEQNPRMSPATANRDSAGPEKTVALELASSPEGAWVFFERVRVGKTPLTVRAPPGETKHYVFRGPAGERVSRDVLFGQSERILVRFANHEAPSTPILQPRHW